MNRQTMRNLIHNATRKGGKALIHVSLPMEEIKNRISDKLVTPKEKEKKKNRKNKKLSAISRSGTEISGFGK